MSCPICGGTMIGDGVTALRHCEFARDEDVEGKEPDAGPVYCVEIVKKLARGVRSPIDDLDSFEMGSRRPEDGGTTACGRLGINHKMRRFGPMDTRCVNPGCVACC